MCAFKNYLLIGVISEALGKIFLAEKTISQDDFFSPSRQVYFCSLIRSFYFIEAESKKGKRREFILAECLFSATYIAWSSPYYHRLWHFNNLSRKTLLFIYQWLKLKLEGLTNRQAIVASSDFEPISILTKSMLFHYILLFHWVSHMCQHKVATINKVITYQDCCFVRKWWWWWRLDPFSQMEECISGTVRSMSPTLPHGILIPVLRSDFYFTDEKNGGFQFLHILTNTWYLPFGF